jgi:hypothetical protein
MTVRDTLITIVGGARLRDERTQNTAALNRVYNAYENGRFRMPPEMLVEQLSEYSSSTVLQLVRQLQAGQSGASWLTNAEDARIYQVSESRQQWLYSPLAQWSVNTWTSYGLGEKVAVICNDKNAQERWNKTWDASRIFADDEIQNMSKWTCVDGEIYLVAFHSVADGSTILEMLETDEIKNIVSDPGNKNNKLYYKREYINSDMQTITAYYPDYHTFFYHPEDLKKANLPSDATIMVSEKMDDKSGTSTTILHIPHNRKSTQSLHGWPILGIAAPYLLAHKSFLEDRLTVSHQKASFAREFITQGGSRGVEAVKSRFDSKLGAAGSSYTDTNPPAVAGSSLIHNSAVEHRDLPMTTGASDAQTDNNMFAWMAGIGAGLFPTTMGLDTSRWATAVAMDKTQAVQWSRYQSFWACQFRKMVEIVLLAAEKWGNQTFEDKGCTVSIDTLSLVDFPGVVTPIAAMINTMGSDATIPEQAKRAILKALWTPVLTALGTDDIDDVLSDDLLEILDEDERAALKLEQEKAKADMAAIRAQAPAVPVVPPVVPPEPVPAAAAEKYRLGISNLALELYHARVIAEKAKEGAK